MAERVSVIVTTRNEERHLGVCLESLRLQTWPEVELVVVDNHSTDHTVEVARRYTPHVYTRGPERSAQRNFGMLEVATGEQVLFVDADMVAAPRLVAACVETLGAHPEAVALHVGEVVLGTSWWSRVRRFERGFYDGTVIDGARYFRKLSLATCGGFDVALWGGEDWDLDKRLKRLGPIARLGQSVAGCDASWRLAPFIRERGVEPLRCGPVLFHNEADFALGRYLSKKRYYSTSLDAYAAKWGQLDPDVRRQLSPLYRFLFVFVEAGRWKRLLRHPLLTLGMYLLRFLVGVAWLSRKRAAT